MQILWKQERAFMKDLIEAYPDPKPAPTTVATLLKRMQDKKSVDIKQYGRSRIFSFGEKEGLLFKAGERTHQKFLQ